MPSPRRDAQATDFYRIEPPALRAPSERARYHAGRPPPSSAPRTLRFATLVLVILLDGVVAVAQPATSSDEPTRAPAAPPAGDEAKRDAAKSASRELVKEAKKLLDRKQYGAALAQYEAAFRVYPSWSARAGAGVCLVRLQRYDEAQETFESVVRDFGVVMPEPAKAQALEQISVMRTVTGGLNVIEAEVGSMIVVDGRVRGEHPAAAPLSVLVGPHLVRVYKQGFALFEASVDVTKGRVETLPARLTALVEERSGRLKVAEVSGKAMAVIVDGVPVGVTPWEGTVEAGEHSIVLRQALPRSPPLGGCGEPPFTEDIHEARVEETIATSPMTAAVKPKETAKVLLKAEPLDTKVKIAPSLPAAEVSIDGVRVGRGAFEGRLKPGRHVLRAEASGYFAETRVISISAGGEEAVELSLRRDDNAPLWAEPGRPTIELVGSAALSPSFGGELASSCVDPCQAGLGAGGRIALRGGYEQGSGLGFGVTAGYMGLSRSTTGRATSLAIESTGAPGAGAGFVNDVVTIQNAMLGAYAGYRIGERFPVRVGLSAGAGLGVVTDVRTGLVGDFGIGPVTQSGFFAWIFVEPELYVGLRWSDRLSLGLSLSGLALVAPRRPLWREEMKISSHNNLNEIGHFKAETVTGTAIFAMTEGLYAAYDF